MFFIGIDIAKRSHQAAVTDVFGNIIIKPFNFKNSSVGFNQFLSMLASNSVPKDDCIIGLESTGHYWYPLYFFLVEQKFNVKVFNPIQTAAFREITIRKVKNDNLDSIMIADFTRFGRYSETHIPSENMLALKNLSRFRLSVCDICGSLKKRTIVLLDQVFPEYDTVFCDIFGTTSKLLLEKFSTPEEFSEISTTPKNSPKFPPLNLQILSIKSAEADSDEKKLNLSRLLPTIPLAFHTPSIRFPSKSSNSLSKLSLWKINSPKSMRKWQNCLPYPNTL